MHDPANFILPIFFALMALTPLCTWACSAIYRSGFRRGVLKALFFKDDQEVYDFLKDLHQKTGVYPYPSRIKVTIE